MSGNLGRSVLPREHRQSSFDKLRLVVVACLVSYSVLCTSCSLAAVEQQAQSAPGASPPLIKLPAPSEARSSLTKGALSGDAKPGVERPAAAGSRQTTESGTAPSGAAGEKKVPLLKLRVAFNEGLMNSPRTAAARAMLGISKSAYWAATVMPDPGFFRDEGAVAEQVRRVGFNLVYEPPWKIAFRLLAAKATVVESKSEIIATLWRFRADVRRAYTEVVVAEATYRILSEIVDLTHKLWEVSQRRFEAGDVPELDVLKARLALSQSEIDKQQGFTRVLRAKQQLNVILGRNVDERIEVFQLPGFTELKGSRSEFLPDFEEEMPPLKDYLDIAMVSRPELKVIVNQIKLAEAQLRTARGNIIPNPNLLVGDSTANNAPSGPKLKGFFVTMNYELPLYNFQQGELARLNASIKQLRLQYQAQKNIVTGEVVTAYQNLVVARNKIRSYREHVLSDSDEVARLARRSYEVGQSDITSTLQAQQAKIQIRNLYLDSVLQYQLAYTDLEQSVGEPLE